MVVERVEALLDEVETFPARERDVATELVSALLDMYGEGLARIVAAGEVPVEDELVAHLLPDDDGRFRYRYCQSAVVAAYGEMTREPPAFQHVGIPTLLVLGETSYIPYDELLEPHAAALGDLLVVERLAAGHTVLWDALDDTLRVVERFLA